MTHLIKRRVKMPSYICKLGHTLPYGCQKNSVSYSITRTKCDYKAV